MTKLIENFKNTSAVELKNLSNYLSKIAVRFPNKPALLHPKRITYQELENEVNIISHGLDKIGITQDIRTILLIPPGPEFIMITFALLRVGAVLVMIDPGMGAKAMANSITGVRAGAFIGTGKAHLLRKFYPDVFKTVRISVTLGRRWFWKGYRFSDLCSEKKKHFPAVFTYPENIAGIFFTSGSTGPAKGVVYTVSMLNAQIQYLKSHFKYNPEEVELCTFPLLGLFSICLGLSLVFADMDTVRPATLDPRKVIANIQNYKCTHMFCSPMVLNRLDSYCKKKQIKLPSLKRINTSGAPVPLELIKSFKQILSEDAEIHTPYGATEALPITNISETELLQNQDKKQDGICVGRSLEGLEIKIIKITDEAIPLLENAQVLPVGEVGEIIVKSTIVSQEYYKKPDANENSKIKYLKSGEIWHRMGDIGRLDENDRLWFYGRKSHRVETSKHTHFTIPIEAVFNQHPQVFRSALVGVHSENHKHKIPILCVQLKQNLSRKDKKKIKLELLELGSKNPLTKTIKEIYLAKHFPVDSRHNAKIQREKLALWVEGKIK